MTTFRCPNCKGTSVQPIASQMWCTCTFRKYVKGGTRTFNVEMEALDRDTRSVPEYELV